MPNFGQYHVNLLDHSGTKVVTLFPGVDFLSMTWEHIQNRFGAYECRLVAETNTKNEFDKWYQLQIERNWGNAPGDWYEEYVGFHLQSHEQWLSSEIDQHYWYSRGKSPECLADQPLLHPIANTGNASWAYYDLWWNHGAADDTIKLMVAESMVSSYDADRDFANMVVQGNTGEGIWGCYEGRWVRLGDAIINAIGEDGSKGGCDYRVARVSGGYEFRTYAPFFGTDRRRGNAAGNNPMIFSMQNGNLKNPERIVSWAEAVTVAYGGWDGNGMEQTIVSAENATALAETPFSRREAFYNLNDVPTQDAVSGYLEQALIDDGEQEFVSAQILQTDNSLYGRDWWFGDLVTVDFPDGASYDMRIISVAGKISGDNEEEIVGTVELWTRG